MNPATSRTGLAVPAVRRATAHHAIVLACLTSGFFILPPRLNAQAAPAAPSGVSSGTASSASTNAAAREDPIQLEAFTSTGTRFNDRTVIESPVPIDVITSAEMTQGGYIETSHMLQALAPSFNFPRPSLTPHRTVPSVISGTTVFNGADNAGSLAYLLNPTPFGFNGAFYYGKVSWKF
jgi:hypothetical protein